MDPLEKYTDYDPQLAPIDAAFTAAFLDYYHGDLKFGQCCTYHRELHAPSDTPFVIANAWDGLSALLLQKIGFQALATSSAASAATLGRADGCISRREALEHAGLIAHTVSCPVSGDLENGRGT